MMMTCCVKECAKICLTSTSCQSFVYSTKQVNCTWFPSAQFDYIDNRTGHLFYAKLLTQVIISLHRLLSVFKRSFIIARQHAVHAERDIVVPILSVCLSVRCRYCIDTNGHIVIRLSY